MSLLSYDSKKDSFVYQYVLSWTRKKKTVSVADLPACLITADKFTAMYFFFAIDERYCLDWLGL